MTLSKENIFDNDDPSLSESSITSKLQHLGLSKKLETPINRSSMNFGSTSPMWMNTEESSTGKKSNFDFTRDLNDNLRSQIQQIAKNHFKKQRYWVPHATGSSMSPSSKVNMYNSPTYTELLARLNRISQTSEYNGSVFHGARSSVEHMSDRKSQLDRLKFCEEKISNEILIGKSNILWLVVETNYNHPKPNTNNKEMLKYIDKSRKPLKLTPSMIEKLDLSRLKRPKNKHFINSPVRMHYKDKLAIK